MSSEADGGANGGCGALRKVGAFCGSLGYYSHWMGCTVLEEGITVRMMMVKSWCSLTGQVCWTLLVDLTQARAIWEEGISVEKLSLSDGSVEMSVGVFS